MDGPVTPDGCGTMRLDLGPYVLGTIDPTSMQNGFYDVRLMVEDTSGQVTTADKVYQVDGQAQLLPQMPGWLLELVRPPPPLRRNPVPSNGHFSNPDAWTRAAVDGELQRLRSATVGTRNDTLNRIAFRLGQIIGAGRLDETTAERLLLDSAVSIGLSEREALATVHSGLRAGERQALPRHEPPGAELP